MSMHTNTVSNEDNKFFVNGELFIKLSGSRMGTTYMLIIHQDSYMFVDTSVGSSEVSQHMMLLVGRSNCISLYKTAETMDIVPTSIMDKEDLVLIMMGSPYLSQKYRESW
jgi:hypothetical protein